MNPVKLPPKPANMGEALVCVIHLRFLCRASAVPSSAALALDAADGVIDGKYFGRRIVDTVGYACCLVPTTTPPQPHCTAPTARATRPLGLHRLLKGSGCRQHTPQNAYRRIAGSRRATPWQRLGRGRHIGSCWQRKC